MLQIFKSAKQHRRNYITYHSIQQGLTRHSVTATAICTIFKELLIKTIIVYIYMYLLPGEVGEVSGHQQEDDSESVSEWK